MGKYRVPLFSCGQTGENSETGRYKKDKKKNRYCIK